MSDFYWISNRSFSRYFRERLKAKRNSALDHLFSCASIESDSFFQRYDGPLLFKIPLKVRILITSNDGAQQVQDLTTSQVHLN